MFFFSFLVKYTQEMSQPQRGEQNQEEECFKKGSGSFKSTLEATLDREGQVPSFTNQFPEDYQEARKGRALQPLSRIFLLLSDNFSGVERKKKAKSSIKARAPLCG